MKVLFLGAALDIYLIPRVYPLITDTLTLSLRNEASDVILAPPVTFDLGEQLKITIIDQPTDFKERNKYELELKNGSAVIYRGKMITLATGTDIQNYEYSTQLNAKFGY